MTTKCTHPQMSRHRPCSAAGILAQCQRHRNAGGDEQPPEETGATVTVASTLEEYRMSKRARDAPTSHRAAVEHHGADNGGAKNHDGKQHACHAFHQSISLHP